MSLSHRIRTGVALLLVAASCLTSAQSKKNSASNVENSNVEKKKDALVQARAQFARGELQSAEASVWAVLASNPDQEQALALLGSIRVRQERYSEAEALFRRVLQIDPKSVPAHQGLGSALAAENQFDSALQEYKAAMELAPRDLKLKLEVAHLYAGQGQCEQALSALQSIPQDRFPAEAVPVKAACFLSLGQNADAASFAEQAKASPFAELELAEVFLDAKRPDRAQRCLDLAAANLKRKPARFYYLQGRVFQMQNRQEEALGAFQQALAADPKLTDALVGIAEVKAARQRHAEAVAELQKAQALSPDNIVVLRHLVVEATKAGNAHLSVEAATALADKSANNPEDLYLSGAALLQQNSAGASTVFEKYVALRKDNAKAWLGLGMAYVQQKRYAEARMPLERSVQLDPNIAEAEYQLGVVAKSEANSEEAIGHFQRAVKLQPQHAKALWSLGNLYLQSGDLAKAQESLQAAEAVDPNNVETEYDLALVLSKLGKPEVAREHFAKFQQLKGEQPPAPRDAR